ncbi:MAG TPA: hypothetical protein VN929_09440 [Burkholderiales bacterium]|nr:hypothetical protein [Burkholderiales bacterium]
MYVLLLPVAIFWGCSSSVMVRVPPRMDLTGYQTMGIIQFASNADATINQYATQQFQEHVQAAQPGTRFIELGTQESVLAAIGAKQLDVDAIKKIGEKYGVAAVFHGNIAYSEPRTDIRVSDVTKLQGGVQSEIKGDIFSKLMETRTGASVWSSSAWATKPIGGLVSGEQGVAVAMRKSNPRFEMIPSMVYHLTTDFRESTVRQRVK